jgi:polysaccharide biosynthesis transport protein
MTQRSMHPLEYLTIVKRRRWWLITPFVVCVAGGVAVALLWPETFRSSATIAVQAATVTPDLVGRGQLPREERLRALEQQLRSPEVLQRVVRDEGLAGDEPVEAVVAGLRSRISVEIPRPITRTDAAPDLSAFDIVYRDSTAERTQRVANRLAHVFVDEHSRSREVQAEGTSDFIAQQLRRSQERISELEAQVRSARERHMGMLPEQTAANLQTLSGMRSQLESTSNNLRSEQDRLTLIERQMQNMRQGLYAAPVGQAATSSPQQRVRDLQRDLATARSMYTDRHPEVQALEEALKQAQAEAAAARELPESSREAQLASDPMYQQLADERNLTQLRIQSLRRAETQLRGEIARYQQRVEAAPRVDQELASITREFQLEQDRYKQLADRLSQAQVQEGLARTRGGERFSVLNAAYRPDAPESPNRARILLMALALGLALGGGAALGREYLDWSIRDAHAIEDLDVQVIAEIPHIRGAA